MYGILSNVIDIDKRFRKVEPFIWIDLGILHSVQEHYSKHLEKLLH